MMICSNGLENLLGALPALTRGKPYHLGGDPKGKNFVYTCGPAVFIRNLAVKICETSLKFNRTPWNVKSILNMSTNPLLPNTPQVDSTWLLEVADL